MRCQSERPCASPLRQSADALPDRARTGEGVGGLNINATGFIGIMMPDAGDTTTAERLRGVGGAALDALRSVCRAS